MFIFIAPLKPLNATNESVLAYVHATHAAVKLTSKNKISKFECLLCCKYTKISRLLEFKSLGGAIKDTLLEFEMG
jgi:hypothetical protein